MTFRELLTTLQDFARLNPSHQALDEHVVVRLQTDDENGDELHVGGLRRAAVDAGCTETFMLTLDADQEPDEPDEDVIIRSLRQVLANRTGRLRAFDAYRLCGIEPGRISAVRRSQFHQALYTLGWERQRCRFDGTLQYAYVRGTPEQREVELVIEGESLMDKVAS